MQWVLFYILLFDTICFNMGIPTYESSNLRAQKMLFYFSESSNIPASIATSNRVFRRRNNWSTTSNVVINKTKSLYAPWWFARKRWEASESGKTKVTPSTTTNRFFLHSLASAESKTSPATIASASPDFTFWPRRTSSIVWRFKITIPTVRRRVVC